MQQSKPAHPNRLDYYRRRMRFSTANVGHLLGHKDGSTFCEYERGNRLPALVNAFRLGIVLRTPVEFLFPALYEALREQIRAKEERAAQPTQSVLF